MRLSEPTEVFHNNIRERFNRGEAAVVDAMTHFAALAAQGREALLAGDVERLSALIDENFDTRRSIYSLPAWQIEQVETARRVRRERAVRRVRRRDRRRLPRRGDAAKSCAPALEAIGSRTIVPQIAE